ncbi:MAG: YqiJ family protein [Spongiibacteraceae bacterium]
MMLFTAAQNIPFGIALALMLGLAVIEVIGLAIAMSPSTWIDTTLLPDLSADGTEGALGWLHVGKVPTLVLLVIFLASFAITGYLVQIVARNIVGFYLPAVIASLPAFAMGITGVRTLGALLARVIPRDESFSVSESEFIGRVAIITAASGNADLASQARLKDNYGRTHYILAEPDLPDLTLRDGMDVLIVRKVGAHYRVIENPHPTLI